MGLFKRGLILLFFACSQLLAHDETDKRHLLFLLHNGQTEKAFTKYLELSENDRQDFDLLQQLSLLLLEKGSKSLDKEIQHLTMVGAGLANSTISLSILENGLRSTDPQTKLIALHFLKNIQDDRVDHLLSEAMGSDFLPIRMEAAYLMSERRHPHAVGHIEALMFRLPPQVKPYFPIFFALIGTPEATTILKSLMSDVHAAVRIESIINAVHMGRDDLLPIIRKRISHGNIGELEAAAYALGKLKDTSKSPMLEKLAESSNANVHLAANYALCRMGDQGKKDEIIKMAIRNNTFAIQALSEIADTEEVLYKLCHSPDLEIKMNAAIALLIKKDPRCIPFLIPLFLPDEKDIAIQPTYSIGKAFLAWKILPSAHAQTKDPLFDIGLSLNIKEYLLREAIDLPEKDFLYLAKMIFDREHNSIVPQLISLLENLQSEKSILLLKEQLSKLGAPLIRDYCHLALFRLGEEGPYESYVRNWVLSHKNDNIMELAPTSHRPVLPKATPYLLTSQEKNRLLIDMLTALAAKQNPSNSQTLVEALSRGNPKNRYLIAGLLLKAIE